MRRRRPSDAAARSRGFTLFEAVLVIAITGVLAGIVANFIVQPVRLYLSTVARADLVDVADAALRRITRDLRAALPNSVRVNASGLAVELIPTTGAARYRTEGSDPLLFGSVDTSFDLIGPALTLKSAQQLVFFNLGNGITGSDAYAPNGTAAEQADSNRRTATNAAGAATAITMGSLAGLPLMDFAAPYRVFAVDTPVTYRCNLAAGTVTRYSGYGFQASQPDPPTGGSSSVLASGVTACRFAYDSAVVAMSAGLVSLQLTLATTTTSGTESITLHHEAHVANVP
jgi:MSHA biogenesis protein MshO